MRGNKGYSRLEFERRRRQSRERVRRQRRMIRIALAAGIAVTAFIVAVVFMYRYVSHAVPDGRIAANIQIDGVAVGGMTTDEAVSALTGHMAELNGISFTFKTEGQEAKATLEELGLGYLDTTSEQLVEEAYKYGREGSIFTRFNKLHSLTKEAKNLEAAYTFDDQTASSVLADRCTVLENAAVNAKIKHTDSGFVITDGIEGKAIDMEQTLTTLKASVGTTWDKSSIMIDVTTVISQPAITADMLKDIKDTLGGFSTYCGTDGTRVQNIQSGTSHINGTIVMPGEEFSANDAMEPYTEDNGYGEAGSYENGKVVDTMGGGICQVSSTLYNALLYAELKITERYEHSLQVTYVKPGKDAAIADEVKDLKFINNTDTPVLIEGYVSDGEVYFNIYGKETRDTGRSVEYISETTGTTESETKYVTSAEYPIGKMTTTENGHNGLTATLWKVISRNGEEVSREAVNYSTYRMTNTVVSVGIASDNSEAVSIVTSAVSSQDASKIESAISQAKTIESAAAAGAAASAAGSTSTGTSTDTNTGQNNGTN